MTLLYISLAIILIYIIGKISLKNDLLFDVINDIIKPIEKYDILAAIVAGIATLLVIFVTFFIVGCIGLIFLLGTNL